MRGARIRDLKNIRDTLEDLYDACNGEGTTSQCPILDAIELLDGDEGPFP